MLEMLFGYRHYDYRKWPTSLVRWYRRWYANPIESKGDFVDALAQTMLLGMVKMNTSQTLTTKSATLCSRQKQVYNRRTVQLWPQQGDSPDHANWVGKWIHCIMLQINRKNFYKFIQFIFQHEVTTDYYLDSKGILLGTTSIIRYFNTCNDTLYGPTFVYNWMNNTSSTTQVHN